MAKLLYNKKGKIDSAVYVMNECDRIWRIVKDI